MTALANQRLQPGKMGTDDNDGLRPDPSTALGMMPLGVIFLNLCLTMADDYDKYQLLFNHIKVWAL